MRLLFVEVSLLSLFALVSRYAHAAAVVGYPYRTAELFGYTPARGGASPVLNSLNQGFVRYVDQQAAGGAHQLIGYKFNEPVQSRRITNEEYLNQLVKSSINKDESESVKARDEHFRLWSMNQYDQYRQETERLKANGQEPSAELLAKIKTLEDIIVSNRPSTSGDETPQSKEVREEHLRIWNAGRSAAAAVAQFASNQATVAPANIASSPNPAIYLRFQSGAHEVVQNVVPAQAQAQPTHIVIVGGETDEQKKAREEHLRIYHEQLQLLQKAHAEAVKVSNINSISGSESSGSSSSSGSSNSGSVSDSHNSVHQTKDAVKVSNINSISGSESSSSSSSSSGSVSDSLNSVPQTKDARAQDEAHTHTQGKNKVHVEQQQQGQQAQVAHGVHTAEHVSYIEETPEVQRAKAEHLRLWQEAKERAEKEAQQNEEHKATANEHHHQSEVHTDTKSYKHEESAHTTAEHQAQQQGFTQAQQDRKYTEEQQQQQQEQQYHQPQQQITDKSDTVTIYAATQDADKYQGKLYGQQQHQQEHQQQQFGAHTAEHGNNHLLPTPVQDTPEVQRARAEHLRIFEELQKQAQIIGEIQANSKKQSVDAAAAQQQAYTTQTQQQYDSATTKLTTTDAAAAYAAQQQAQLNAAVQDTAEVQRAREEHLKLLKEAHLKAQTQYQSESVAQMNTNEAQSTTTYTEPTADKLPELTSQNNVDNAEEARLRAEEAKQREAERLAELARLKEEERLLAEEQKRLQLEEQRRQEQERAEQARLDANEKSKNDEHYAERPQLPSSSDEKSKQTAEQQIQQKPTQTDGTQRAFASSSAYVGNDKDKYVIIDPQLVRPIPAAAAAVGRNQVGAAIPTTAFYIGAEQLAQQQQQQQQQPQPLQNFPNGGGYYYLRNIADGSYLKVDNPYVLQYLPGQTNGNEEIGTVGGTIPFTSALFSPLNIKAQAGKPITNYQVFPSPGSPTYKPLLGPQAYLQSLSPYKQTLGPSPSTQNGAPYRPSHHGSHSSSSGSSFEGSSFSGSYEESSQHRPQHGSYEGSSQYRPQHGTYLGSPFKGSSESQGSSAGLLPYKPSFASLGPIGSASGSSLGSSSGISPLSIASALFTAANAGGNANTPFSNPNAADNAITPFSIPNPSTAAQQQPPIFPLQPTRTVSEAARPNSSGSDAGLAALEQATRDHFRAHELALAQLRSANGNQAEKEKKDC